jgi:ABC transporter ATM
LQEGQVAEQGSHEELLKIEGGVYQRLWTAQLSENTSSLTPAGSGTEAEPEKEEILVESQKK